MTGFNQLFGSVAFWVPVFVLTLALSIIPACSLATGKTKPLANSRSIELGTNFHHVVLRKPGYKTGQSPLRVYIEGDGRPFISRTSIARDPTPKHAPVLALWELDFGDAIYIGRPCYMGLAKLPECNVGVWTSGRYNGLIVESMQSVAERYSGGRPIVLIGHSGGGTLAMLIADRMSKQSTGIAAVVTLSGNLDVVGWTELHGYTALHQSDSPVDKLPLPDGIAQLHLVAGRDRKIPPYLTRKLANRLPADSICEVSAYDHNCCWSHRWTKFLGALEKHLATGGAGLGAACEVF